MKPRKTIRPDKSPESRRGFVDFRELKEAHTVRLRQNFSKEIVPAIERFNEIVSLKEQSLKNRLNEAVAFMKQDLLERGVSKDLEIQAEGYGQSINAIHWLSNQLAKSTVVELEKTLKQGQNLTGISLPRPDIIEQEYNNATASRSRGINFWRGETTNLVQSYLQTKFSE